VADTFGTPTNFIIKELTGEKRTLQLAGRALPYGPIVFSGTMGLESTWYPGSPIATTQVFGAREDESTFKGMWKDVFVKESSSDGNQIQFTAIATISDARGNSNQASDVMQLATFVDDVRRKGQLIKVSWDEIVRVGFLQKFTQSWHRRQDLEWEMTFSWISQGDQPSPAVFSGQQDLGNIKASWDQISVEMSDAIANNPFDVLNAFSGPLDALGQAISDFADEVTDTIATVVQAVNTPSAIAGRLTAIYSNVADSADQIKTLITSVPPPDLFFFDAVPGYGDQLRAEAYATDVGRKAAEVERQALEQLSDMLKNIDPDLLGTYIAKAGDDLRAVSTAYFDSPDSWRSLMAFNELLGSELSAGQIVLIPKSLGNR